MNIDLKGKVAVVTGAAGGIGKAIAKLFLANGAAVVIADVNDALGAETVKELTAIGSAEKTPASPASAEKVSASPASAEEEPARPAACEYIHADISDKASAEGLVETVAKKYGRIDIFVNNAGVNVGPSGRVDIDKFSDENWEKLISIDLTGTFYCSRAAARVMIKQKSGRIINIGSVLGNIPARKQIAFLAAKAGVHNMTKGMALELASYGINVNAVAPGSTLTEGTRELFYGGKPEQVEFAKRLLEHIPLGRPGEVEDIANAVLFLAGEESRYITGQVITVDGGWTAGYARDF